MVAMNVVWDRTAEFLSDNLAAVMPIVLLALFVPFSISGSLTPLAPESAGGATALNLVSLALALVTLWGQLAVIALALDPLGGRSAAIATANRRFLPAVGLSLLLLAIVIALALPLPIAFVLGGVDLQAVTRGGEMTMPSAVGWFVALYILLLIPLLIWLSARLALLTPVIVMERRGVRVFARSFVLTHRVVWKIVGMSILYGVVALVSYLAAQFAFGSVLTLIVGGEGPLNVATVLTSIFTSAVLTGFTVLATAFVAKLYLAVRDAREAIVDSQ